VNKYDYVPQGTVQPSEYVFLIHFSAFDIKLRIGRDNKSGFVNSGASDAWWKALDRLALLSLSSFEEDINALLLLVVPC
jgi:hypothetical protein